MAGWRGVSPPLDSCVLHKLRKIPFPVFLDGDLKQHNPRWQCKGGRRARVFHVLRRSIVWCVLLQVIMTTADAPASKEAVTAALLVISVARSCRPHQGPKDRLYRGISDGGRHRFQGSAGGWRRGESDRRCSQCAPASLHLYLHHRRDRPTHGDITTDCVAKAFGVPIDTDPRALAILHEWV